MDDDEQQQPADPVVEITPSSVPQSRPSSPAPLLSSSPTPEPFTQSLEPSRANTPTPLNSIANGSASANVAAASSISRPVSTSLQEQTTPFEQALKAWRDINFSELQRQLDSQGLEIVENQKVSVLGRKELASKTKEFRKLSDEEKLVEIKTLLKSYQTEIDKLTKRGKVAENAFLNTYRALAEAPDPFPLLEATLDSLLASDEVATLSTENAKLKSQLARYSDYDDLRVKLQQTEQKVLDVSTQKVAAKEAELQALLDEKERNWKLREEDLNKQVHEAREQVRELRATHAVTEARLVQHEQKLDEGVAGRFAEAELIAADLERVNLRALQTERRNLELRQELERLKSSLGRDGETGEPLPFEDIDEWKRKIDDLRGENAALGRKMESLREEAKAASEKESKAIRALEREGTRKAEEIEGLKNKLKRMADYEDIKRELDILKFVEFSAETEEDETWKSNYQSDAHSESLEQLLLARNKRLTTELTTIRVAHETLRQEFASLESNLKSTTAALEQSRSLNRKLEDDLTSLHETASVGNPGAMSIASYAPSRRSGRGTDTASMFGGSLRSGLTAMVSSIANEEPVSQPGSGTVTPVGMRSLDQHVADLTILPIITQQRDRFRARNAELEQELRSEYSRITELRGQIEALQKDNVALYEKTRYLSTYRGGTSASAVNAGGSDMSSTYHREYEEQISPFAQFRGREQERALSRMGPLERIIYGLTRVVLANKTSRNLFFGYIMGLHLFLMGTIWYLAFREVGQHEKIATPGAGVDQIAAIMGGGAATFGSEATAGDSSGKEGWVLAAPHDVVSEAVATATNVAAAAVQTVAVQVQQGIHAAAGGTAAEPAPVAADAGDVAGAAPAADGF
ncbi:CASP C terminal-domain-containing protein [Lipomyces tetrasporus]|uniref:Protein CASP n=1 Tax=Lipomyces tetrasporus TaxID=54092 RepID=A0AAD7QX01_9ASCO|nr:CASP C terminal-domain-containing protein [Lipomyces tetrasporus]KAJ8102900.1 CASP C terminal-domain-containing protein [Lipomyces tetrasporus]